jgi:hypothetical protein
MGLLFSLACIILPRLNKDKIGIEKNKKEETK